MLSSRQRLALMELAAIGAPLLLVYVGRVLLSSAPPVANAIQVSAPTIAPTPTVQAKPLSAEQQKAAAWVKSLPQTMLKSPLNHLSEIVIKPKDPMPDPVAPTPKESPVKGLKLTAVVGNDDERLASINGKIYRIGEAIRKGLNLTTIDARNSVITLTDDEGKTYELKREK